MKKITVILTLLLVISTFLFAAASYDATVENASDLISSVVGTKTPVAFVSLDSESASFSSRFISDLEEALMKNGCLVLDRANIEEVKKELKLQLSGFVSNKDAVSVGNMLGAKLIITGKAQGEVSSYHLEISVIDVETSALRIRESFDIKYDQNLTNIIEGNSTNIGSQKLSVGLRGGVALEFNKAHEDMVGTEAKPKESSPTTLIPTLVASYNVFSSLKVQTEVSYVTNNGIKVEGYHSILDDREYTLNTDLSYGSLDIPAILSWTFIKKPVTVDAFLGGYISLPMTALNMGIEIIETGADIKRSLDMEGNTFGVLGGFSVGVPMGPGSFVMDARICYDLTPSKAKTGESGNGMMTRRLGSVSAGYMFHL